MLSVYLAGRLSQKEEIRRFASKLRARGIEVTSRWLKEVEAPSITMAEVPKETLLKYADQDIEDIDRASLLIFFSCDPLVGTVRGGRHVEFGYALAKNLVIWVIGPKENLFHFLPDVKHFKSSRAVLNRLGELGYAIHKKRGSTEDIG